MTKRILFLAVFMAGVVTVRAQARIDSLYPLLKFQSFGHIIHPADDGFYVIGNGTDMAPYNSQASIFTSFTYDGDIRFSTSTLDSSKLRLYQDLNAVIIDSIAYTTFVGTWPIQIMQFNIHSGHVVHRADLHNIVNGASPAFPYAIHRLDSVTLLVISSGRRVNEQYSITQLSLYDIRTDSFRYYLSSYPGYTQHITDVVVRPEGLILGGHIYRNINPGDHFMGHATVVWLDSNFKEIRRYISSNESSEFSWLGYNLIMDLDGSLIGTICPGYKYLLQEPYHVNSGRPALYKLGPDGNFLWQRPMGRDLYFNGINRFHGLIRSNLGDGYIGVGRQTNFNDFLYYHTAADTNAYGENLRFDALIAKVSVQGDSIWSRTYYTADYLFSGCVFFDIISHPDGGYILSGYGDKAPPSDDSTRFYTWILYVDEYGCAVPGCHETVRADDPELPAPVRLYPNPATETLFVFQQENETIRYAIVNMEGRVMASFVSGQAGSTAVVDVRRYPPGQYAVIKKDAAGRSRSATWVKL